MSTVIELHRLFVAYRSAAVALAVSLVKRLHMWDVLDHDIDAARQEGLIVMWQVLLAGKWLASDCCLSPWPYFRSSLRYRLRALRYNRIEKRRRRVRERVGIDYPEHIQTPASEAMPDDDRAYLRRAVDSLTPSQRDAIVGLYLDGRHGTDIAASHGRHATTISQAKQRGLAALRKLLTRQSPTGEAVAVL